MRRMTPILFALLLAAPAAAAPTCQNRLGDAVRCEAKDAMPVGWSVSPEEFRARALARTPPAEPGLLIATGGVVICLLALFALLPKFDGAQDEDWDEQSDDGA